MLTRLISLGALSLASLLAQPNLSIRLPERTRLLEDQRLDVVIELRNATASGPLRVTADGTDISSRFGTPRSVDLDCNVTQDTVFRADLLSFTKSGQIRLTASVPTNMGVASASREITVYPFQMRGRGRNVILFIGDAMGTTYRDAARLVSRSVENSAGLPGLRGGYFDNLLEMDKMPVSGMAMTYASDRVVPDSANTASTWSNGNKIFYNALNVLEDGSDCYWRAAGRNSATLAAMTDNPRLETLWEYLKRKHNYRAGIVTTADVTDATPAGEGAHVAHREARAEISRQYINNPFLGGRPIFDVILGGGMEQFEADKRADGRNLINEFRSLGYQYVTGAAELRRVTAASGRLLGLFRRGNNASLHSSGIRATPDGNMNVAYDKLGLKRPASEPQADFGGFEDQPMLDLMTQKAIEVLGGPGGDQPFILMVEGASIDKQSHPNHAAGVIWDTIELDKSVGVARRFLHSRRQNDTLVVVSADHDQSMHIIGLTEIDDNDLFDRSTSFELTMNSPVGEQKARVFKDSNTNVRAGYNYSRSGGDPNSTGREGPPAYVYGNIPGVSGFPDYIDKNGDGYPENEQVGNKGRRRLSVGFRTGNHTGSSVPVTAEGAGALLFTGWMDQGDLMFKMAHAASGDASDLDQALDRMLRNDTFVKTPGK